MKSARRWLLPPRPVLAILGVLLLAASAWKGHALLTRPIVLAPNVWTTRWFQTGLVEAELVLGLWLLGGLYPRRTWLLALACFFAFFELNFYLLLAGEKSCPCFGSMRTHPGQTALLDLAAVIALLACKPFPEGPGPTVHSHPERFRAFLVIFGLLGIPAVVLLGSRPDPSFLPALRQDRALAERMSLRVNHPTNGELLAILQKNTGLLMTADAALTEEETSFGKASLQNLSACSLMEQMLGKQSTQASWVKTEEGYRLVRAPFFHRWLPWIIAAVLLGLVSAVLVRFRRKVVELSPRRSLSGTA